MSDDAVTPERIQVHEDGTWELPDRDIGGFARRGPEYVRADVAEAEHLRLAKGYQRQYDTMEREVVGAEAAVERVRAVLGEVVDWLGVPGWNGPELPVDLARRIIAALDPPAAPEAEAPTCPHPDDRRGPDGDWCSACGRPVCVACGGSGRSAFLAGSRPCPRCGGSGVVPTPTEEP